MESNDFYREDIYYIYITIIYVNKQNEIEKIIQEPFYLHQPNIISRSELISIIAKKNKLNFNDYIKKYSLLMLLKFNFNIENEFVEKFLFQFHFEKIPFEKREQNDTMGRNPLKNNNFNCDFLENLRNINDIIFDKTINFFGDLNELIIVFYEKEPCNNNNSLANITNKNYTKKISLNIYNENIKKFNRFNKTRKI